MVRRIPPFPVPGGVYARTRAPTTGLDPERVIAARRHGDLFTVCHPKIEIDDGGVPDQPRDFDDIVLTVDATPVP